MFVKIVVTIILFLAVLALVTMFSHDGLTAIGNAPGLVTGIAPFAFMIPVRIRPGSLVAYMTATREAN